MVFVIGGILGILVIGLLIECAVGLFCLALVACGLMLLVHLFGFPVAVIVAIILCIIGAFA